MNQSLLARTPPMGWNSWNTFGPRIDETLILETADAMVASGLRDAGYGYLVLDDAWMAPERVGGHLVGDPERFPSGMAALGEEIHARGLRFGIYSCAGTHTCERFPASYGFEGVDADDFASWGVDFLKYDYCYTAAGVEAVTLYRRMGQALRATGRDIVYSICEWGQNEPWNWGASVGAHMWRTTWDIFDVWSSVVNIGFERQVDLHPYAGPGHWNDPDMLVVGMRGDGHVGRGGMTDAEYRSHFALWCLLASPLMIGCDVRSMDDETSSILLDERLIAINQDRLGRQARLVGRGRHGPATQTWAKPLADGSWAVGFFNLGDDEPWLVSLGFEELGFRPDDPVRVEELGGAVHDGVRGSFSLELEPHHSAVVAVTPERSLG